MTMYYVADLRPSEMHMILHVILHVEECGE